MAVKSPLESEQKPPEIDQSTLINPSDAQRKAFWSDAAASLDRRISDLERGRAFGMWSLPLVAALSFALAAFALSAFLYAKLRHSFFE